MSAIMCPKDNVIVDASERGQAFELIRGAEAAFLARLLPLVHRESILLDLGSVVRVDAAGLAALITIYCEAVRAGHSFAVTDPRPRIRQLLALVGLDRILMTDGSQEPPPFRARLERSAA